MTIQATIDALSTTAKPTTKPIRKATGDKGTRFELHKSPKGYLELWACYDEWIKVGAVANPDAMGTAIANHEEELRCLVASYKSFYP
tara:strand:+ start:637 stop:897 length:261 start_codon:yes stop_codon:yes gene_type:complete